MGERSVMMHREEVLEVSKVQRGKGGVGERLERCTRKRVGRSCWKFRVSDTLLVQGGTVFVCRQSIFRIESMRGSTA